jgi:hypothetical protein
LWVLLRIEEYLRGEVRFIHHRCWRLQRILGQAKIDMGLNKI